MPRDLLVIDLGANGLNLTPISENDASFDIDNDSFRERVSWIQPNEGFLVRDINFNGIIDDASEMFGDTQRDGHEHLARSEEHTSELQSLMRISYAVFCLKKKK